MKFIEALILAEETVPAFCEYANRALQNIYFGNSKSKTRTNSANKYGTRNPKDKLLYGNTTNEIVGKNTFRKMAISYWNFHYQNKNYNNFINLLDDYLSAYSLGGGLL